MQTLGAAVAQHLVVNIERRHRDRHDLGIREEPSTLPCLVRPCRRMVAALENFTIRRFLKTRFQRIARKVEVRER
jgi:hypothetical protein